MAQVPDIAMINGHRPTAIGLYHGESDEDFVERVGGRFFKRIKNLFGGSNFLPDEEIASLQS